MNTIVKRNSSKAVAALALAVGLAVGPALAANAEGWVNFGSTSCGSKKAWTKSFSNGVTEHFQRTVGGAEWVKSWDNLWVFQTREHSFGLSTLSFAQVWTANAMVSGSISCK